ncbi:MAG: SH3 domain-containing protein [Gammaproteobacteria bacterium]|nr:SH3 domain-containing protein [Gammaproteobacteria bacterium]
MNLKQIAFLLFVPTVANAVAYEVINVEQNDTLNMRADASPRAKLVKRIPYNAKNVEFLGQTKDIKSSIWFKIRYDNAEGWVNSRYLQQHVKTRTAKLDDKLSCIGTEPAWSLDRADKLIKFSMYYEAADSFTVQKITKATNQQNQWKIVASGAKHSLDLALTETSRCSDEMSGFIYRYEAKVGTGSNYLSGCCNKIGGTEN